jgi:hypothetical protein
MLARQRDASPWQKAPQGLRTPPPGAPTSSGDRACHSNRRTEGSSGSAMTAKGKRCLRLGRSTFAKRGPSCGSGMIGNAGAIGKITKLGITNAQSATSGRIGIS